MASTAGLTVSDPPSTAFAPVHAGSCALEAVQLVAFVLPQVSSLDPPAAMALTEAESSAVTAGPTVTVALAAGLVAPPAPVHVTEYAVVAAGETETLPLGASPVAKPTPVQLVALPPLQESVLEPPCAIASGVAVSVAETAAPTVTVTEAGLLVAPPAPVQVTEYAVFAVGETGAEPLAAPPVVNPVPRQLVAFDPFHCRVAVPPSAIAGGVAVSVAVTLLPTVTMAWATGLTAPPVPLHVTA